jgi:hypothetical protein
MDTNDEQTLTLDGKYQFVEVPKGEKFTGKSDCHGCALIGISEPAPPCSPGVRKDGKRGIWMVV